MLIYCICFIFRVYAIHKLAKTPFVFPCTNCSGTTSFFKGIGKKKSWEARNVMPEITPIFAQLGSNGVNSTISATTLNISSALFVLCTGKNLPMLKSTKLVMQSSLKE